MPVIGKIYVVPEDCTLEKMKVGDEGYIGIDYDYMTFTKQALFIDRTTTIQSLEDLEQELYVGEVKVKRIGSGFTNEDFEIDFTECEDMTFYLEPMNVYHNLMKEKIYYVIFPCDMHIVSKKVTISEVSVKDLQEELQEALVNEDYKRADELTGEIKKRKEQTKK